MSRYVGSARLARCGRNQGSLDAQHSGPARKEGPGSSYTYSPTARIWPAATFPAGHTCESRLCISAAVNATGAVRGASQPGQQPSAASITRRAVQTLMAVRVTTGGWKSTRSPERPAAVRVDECEARADVRGGHAAGMGRAWACLRLLRAAACACTQQGVSWCCWLSLRLSTCQACWASS